MKENPIRDLLAQGNWGEDQALLQGLRQWQYAPVLWQAYETLQEEALFHSQVHGPGHIHRVLLLAALLCWKEGAPEEMVRQVFRAGVGYLSRPDYETLRARYAGTAMLQYHLDTRQVLPGTVEEFLAADARPVEELFFLTDSPQTKQALRQCLADLPGIGFADPFPNDLEVIAGEIDKGEALRYLLDRLDIAPEEVLAMGDGGSDLPLLQAAGIGVAMGNATEAVKAGADFVTASCEADGVALAIEKFVLSEGETL